MKLSMIVAVAENDVIGKENALPWDLIRDDMKWFRQITDGKVVVMGSSTWDSLPSAYQPLPNRANVVLTTRGAILGADLTLEGDTKLILVQLAAAYPDQEIVIMGGAKVYEDFMPYIETLYLSRVQQTVEGDTVLHVDQMMAAHGGFELEKRIIPPAGEVVFEVWNKKNEAVL